MNDDFRRLVPAEPGVETMRITSPPIRYMFRAEGEEIGVFEYDTDAKAWKFEGDAEESAKLFVEYVLKELEK